MDSEYTNKFLRNLFRNCFNSWDLGAEVGYSLFLIFLVITEYQIVYLIIFCEMGYCLQLFNKLN